MENCNQEWNFHESSFNSSNSFDDSSNFGVISNNHLNLSNNSFKHPFESPPPSSSPKYRDRSRKSKCTKLLFSEDEEEDLEISLKTYYDKDLHQILETSFKKKNFTFNVRGAKLPDPSLLFTESKWKHNVMTELQNIKTRLNLVKSKLNEYNLNTWHKHTRSMNPADRVMKYLRRDMKVEFLTQAWCKFYEIVNKYKLVPSDCRDDNALFSMHLCEAPGAFVASLNHYIKLNYPDLSWKWVANSLNPYYEGNHLSEMINDDRFMLQTIDKWDFGPDMTGDITHQDYPNYLLLQYQFTAPHLITADGSFDCQDKPEEQESSVSWLHLKETLNALNILKKDGNFVIKMFTFFECDTVCLLNLLAVAFYEVIVDKPATSKEGNSEVYVICKKYKGRSAIEPFFSTLLKTDLETFKNFSMLPFSFINRIFYREIVKCALHFAEMQIAVIERNIKLFSIRNDPDLKKHCDFLQEKFVDNFIKRYKLRPLKLKDNIVTLPKFRLLVERRPPQVIESRDRKQGSHAERVKRSSLVANDLLEKINEELNDDLCNNLQEYLPLSSGNEISTEVLDIRRGKPISNVCSSQFCHGRFIRIRNEMIRVYGISKYNIASIELNFQRKEEPRSFCDVSPLYINPDYNTAQIESFKILYHNLYQLNEGDDLKLYGYPMLTQFNVDVMCVLRQFFREIIYSSPATIILKYLDISKRDKWMFSLTKVYSAYVPNNAVISFLPVRHVTGSSNAFYKWLVDANNCRLYHEITRVIDFKPRT